MTRRRPSEASVDKHMAPLAGSATPLTNRIPFISLRLWKQHNDPDQMAELLRILKKHPGACDEIWFATEYGFPPVDVHRKSAEAMVRAAEQVRRAGLVASLQVSNTLGHGDVMTHDYDGITWQRMVGPEGSPPDAATVRAIQIFTHTWMK